MKWKNENVSFCFCSGVYCEDNFGLAPGTCQFLPSLIFKMYDASLYMHMKRPHERLVENNQNLSEASN